MECSADGARTVVSSPGSIINILLIFPDGACLNASHVVENLHTVHLKLHLSPSCLQSLRANFDQRNIGVTQDKVTASIL